MPPQCDVLILFIHKALVYHDMLGFTEHPQHVNFVPRFCKKFACVGDEVTRGLEAYRHDVLAGTFPGEEGEYSPYILPPKEVCCQSIAVTTGYYRLNSSPPIYICEYVYRRSC